MSCLAKGRFCESLSQAGAIGRILQSTADLVSNMSRLSGVTGVRDAAGGLGPVRPVMDAGPLRCQLRSVLPILHRHCSTWQFLLLYRAGEQHHVNAMACMMCTPTTLHEAQVWLKWPAVSSYRVSRDIHVLHPHHNQ